MRHFIAYHNTEKMGRSLHDGEPLRLLTNKHVNHLLQNMVWFVTGEGAGARQYSLGSVFNVAEVGDAAEDGFKRFAAGTGHVFGPPIPIKELPWFQEVLRATGHFGLGVQEIKDEAVIAALNKLAAQNGYEVPTARVSRAEGARTDRRREAATAGKNRTWGWRHLRAGAGTRVYVLASRGHQGRDEPVRVAR